MKCFFCKGEMASSVTTKVTDLESRVIIIRNTPCHKCKQCGEISFSLDVAERLEQILDTLSGTVTEIAVIRYTHEAA